MEKWQNYFNYHRISSFITLDMQRSILKTLWTVAERWSQVARNSVFDCHLLPAGRQMDKWQPRTLVSNGFWSTFLESINVCDCRLSGVFIDILKTEPGQSETRARRVFHVSFEKIILFRCMFNDAMVDISANNWIKLFGTDCAWKEGI